MRTVRVAMPGPDPGVTELGTNVQLVPAGRLEAPQARSTVPLNPLVAVTVMVDEPDCPGEEIPTEVAPREKSGVAAKPGHEVTSMLALTEPSPVTK